MPRCSCAGSTCGCKLQGGAGIEVIGLGTTLEPYEISAELGQLSDATTFVDTATVVFTVVGDGTPSDPLVISAVAPRQPFPAYTTAGRPSAAASGVGAYYFDTTTELPMWSDGAVWQDGAPAGGGGATAWGDITGTLADQTDLLTALNAKITGFADPGADRIVFWDDSATAYGALSVGGALRLLGTVLDIPVATTAAQGSVALATSAATQIGSNGSDAVTPAGLLSTRGMYVDGNAQTGTTYAPALTDQGKLVTLTNAAAITVTLPLNATTAFPIWSSIDFVGLGAGLVTFAPDGAASVVGTPSLTTRAQYSAATAIKISTNGWLVIGDLA